MTKREIIEEMEPYDDNMTMVFTHEDKSYEVLHVGQQTRPYLDGEDEEQYDKVITIE